MENISFLASQWSIYEMMFYFIIYSVVGWLIEVVYMTFELKRFDNRGFLNGPICPIYGFGMIIIIIVLFPFMERIAVMFIISMVMCTSLELVVGVLMMRLFNNIWWDYSHEKFNYKGYICLKVSILWGVGCVVVMKVVHPLIEKGVSFIPVFWGKIIIYTVFAIVFADFIVSLLTVKNLNMRIKQLDEIAVKLRKGSDFIGSNLSDEVLKLNKRYELIVNQKKILQNRIIRAFPEMKSIYFNKSLEVLKQKVHKKNR